MAEPEDQQDRIHQNYPQVSDRADQMLWINCVEQTEHFRALLRN